MTMQDVEEYVFEVDARFDHERADKAVHNYKNDFSRSQIQKLFEKGLVWRDDDSLRKSQKVYEGDRISFNIPPKAPFELRPVELPLDIIYEDDDLIAVNKAPGMVTHPGAATGEDTLVHALLHHCKGNLSSAGGRERPGIVHRLDKETSGVIIVAKSDRAFLNLSKDFAERRMEKSYLALIRNTHIEPKGIIEAPIGRHPTHRTKMSVQDRGRYARSDWTIQIRFDDAACLLNIRIHTGRTHQIRVHLCHLGCPVAGDNTYGWRKPSGWKTDVHRVMLHAARIGFSHPVNGKEMLLEAPLPDDMDKLLRLLQEQFGSKTVS